MSLTVQHISKTFGDHRVLDDISFTVDGGQVCGLLGANGAGKTTLLRIINRLIEPDAGQVLLDGHPITQGDMGRIGYLPEERGLYRRMRAGEQALYLARLKGMSHSAAEAGVRAWFSRLGMEDWYDRPVNRLSKGMQQKLQFVVTVVHHPTLLILDEPFSGFDQENAAMLQREIVALKEQGVAIILSTHNLQAADALCDKRIQL